MDRRGSFLQRIKRGGYEEMKRRPELDYMNAAACLLVILIHAVSYTHLTLPTIYSV